MLQSPNPFEEGMLNVGLAVVLLTAAAIAGGCSNEPPGCGNELGRQQIQSIVDKELIRRFGSSVRETDSVNISREECTYVYVEFTRPAVPGGWFGMMIDQDGDVIHFQPGY